MHGDVFAEDVVIADAQPGWLVSIFQILRRVANDAARVKTIMRTDGRLAGEVSVWPDGAIRSDDDVFVNDRVRADLHGRIESGLGMNNGGWMNHHSEGDTTIFAENEKAFLIDGKSGAG